MNIDLGTICEAQMNDVIKSGFIETQIRTSIENTVKTTIERELEHYGNLHNKIVESVKQSLQFDVKEVDLPLYGKFISAVVTEVLDECITLELKEKFKNAVTNSLSKDIKPQYTLQEIVDEFKSYNDYCKGYDDYITLQIKKTSCETTVIYLSEDADKPMSDCEICFRIDDKTNRIYDIQSQLGDKNCINCGGFETFLYRLSAYNSEIIINDYDENLYNLYYMDEDC